MTTLISVRYGDGETRRCDSHCYDAKSPDCTCVCGGKNHGAGLKKAAENVREHMADVIAKLEGKNTTVTVDREADSFVQGELL